jgi:hypothetical protein
MEYMEQAQMAFIGLQVMPLYPTRLREATFSVIPKEALLKIPDTARAPRGTYNRGDWTYERGLYNCSFEHGWEEPMDDTERAMFDQVAPGMADYIAAQRAINFILRSQEQRIANKVMNTANFTPNAVGTKWTDHENSTPVDDVNAAVELFRLQCGMLPDALVINFNRFVDLKNNQQIIDRIKYTYPMIDLQKMSAQVMASAFTGVGTVLIGGSIFDSSGVGQDANITSLWPDALGALVKISNGMDLTSPGIGRTFLWIEDSATNPIVEEYREEKVRSDIFRCRHNTDERYLQSYDDNGNVVSNIAAACTYLLSNLA